MKYYIDNYKLIYIQLIRSPVNCNDQFFHLNYNGDCSTYIIPLTEFNKLNGTKYLFFYDELNYEKYFYYLLKLSDEVLNDEDIISKLYDTDKEIIQNDTEVDEDLINETLVKNNRIKYNIN